LIEQRLVYFLQRVHLVDTVEQAHFLLETYGVFVGKKRLKKVNFASPLFSLVQLYLSTAIQSYLKFFCEDVRNLSSFFPLYRQRAVVRGYRKMKSCRFFEKY